MKKPSVAGLLGEADVRGWHASLCAEGRHRVRPAEYSLPSGLWRVIGTRTSSAVLAGTLEALAPEDEGQQASDLALAPEHAPEKQGEDHDRPLLSVHFSPFCRRGRCARQLSYRLAGTCEGNDMPYRYHQFVGFDIVPHFLPRTHGISSWRHTMHVWGAFADVYVPSFTPLRDRQIWLQVSKISHPLECR